MTDKIIDLLPSPDLKAKIKETSYTFSEFDLLQIIYFYSKSFDDRISMLREFAKISSSYVSALAEAYIDYESEQLRSFEKNDGGFIYELEIKENPDSGHSSYLCASYRLALDCIDSYYAEYGQYGAKEGEHTRYLISKRRIFSDPKEFDSDTYIVCTLGAGKTLISLYNCKEDIICNSDLFCEDCQRVCPHKHRDLYFPSFIESYDEIIDYFDNGKHIFCVCPDAHNYKDKLVEQYFAIPLDSPSIREKRFEDSFYDHIHVPPPNATKATPNDLDEKARKNYFDFVEYMRTHLE